MRVAKSEGKKRAFILAAATVGFAHHSQATTKTWTGGNSIWSTSSNWSLPGRPNSASDMALLVQHATVNYNVTSTPFDVGTVLLDSQMNVTQSLAGTQLNAGTLLVGVDSTGTYSLSNGTLNVTTSITLGQNTSGMGTFCSAEPARSALILKTSAAAVAATSSSLAGKITRTNSISPGQYSLSAGSLAVTSLSGARLIQPNRRRHTAVTGNAVSRINLFSVSSGSFDLNNHDMIINAGSITTIAGEIKSAYSNGGWTGSGLTSTSAKTIAADVNNSHKTALGCATAAGINIGTFDGQPVSGSQVLVKYTWSGDANLDGTVNLLDLNALATNFGASSPLWYQGDFNYNSSIDINDFNLLALNFGQVLPASGPPVQTPTALGAVVPEPAGVMAVLIGVGLARRGRARGGRVRLSPPLSVQ